MPRVDLVASVMRHPGPIGPACIRAPPTLPFAGKRELLLLHGSSVQEGSDNLGGRHCGWRWRSAQINFGNGPGSNHSPRSWDLLRLSQTDLGRPRLSRLSTSPLHERPALRNIAMPTTTPDASAELYRPGLMRRHLGAPRETRQSRAGVPPVPSGRRTRRSCAQCVWRGSARSMPHAAGSFHRSTCTLKTCPSVTVQTRSTSEASGSAVTCSGTSIQRWDTAPPFRCCRHPVVKLAPRSERSKLIWADLPVSVTWRASVRGPLQQ